MPLLLLETRSPLALSLSERLRARGHQVLLASSESEARERLQSLLSLRNERLCVLLSPCSLATSHFAQDLRLAFGRNLRLVVLEAPGPEVRGDASVPFPYEIEALERA